MNILNKIIHKNRNKGFCGVQAFIDCPNCDGGLIHHYWSHFAGVEWAECTTDGCFRYEKNILKPKLVLKKKTKLVLKKKPKLVLKKKPNQRTLF